MLRRHTLMKQTSGTHRVNQDESQLPYENMLTATHPNLHDEFSGVLNNNNLLVFNILVNIDCLTTEYIEKMFKKA